MGLVNLWALSTYGPCLLMGGLWKRATENPKPRQASLSDHSDHDDWGCWWNITVCCQGANKHVKKVFSLIKFFKISNSFLWQTWPIPVLKTKQPTPVPQTISIYPPFPGPTLPILPRISPSSHIHIKTFQISNLIMSLSPHIFGLLWSFADFMANEIMKYHPLNIAK